VIFDGTEKHWLSIGQTNSSSGGELKQPPPTLTTATAAAAATRGDQKVLQLDILD